VFVLVLAALLAACGGSDPSPESVVRAWSNALNEGDDEEAAKLFAVNARVIQSGRSLRLRDLGDAMEWHAGLPCGGTIVELRARGETVRATFELGERPEQTCDGPGEEVRALFRVREGKIVLWHQLPAPAPDAPGRDV
jgi:xanthine/CO dehydrogenase XdhC/CoxF family maturation factor